LIINRTAVEDLIGLSLDGLQRMYDPSRELLFTRRFEGGPERSDHLSPRYTVMSSVGLASARAAGYETALDPRRLLESGLDAGPQDAIDHLGMALWSSAVQGGTGLEARILPRLLRRLEREDLLHHVVGRVPAWALIGLSLHFENEPSEAVRTAARFLRDLALQRCFDESGGLFRHFVTGIAFAREQTLFSTQIYWALALAEYGRVFGDIEALRAANICADTLIRLRDRFGGYAWRYHAHNGTIAERFPVYSVHQDGMAPMALFSLARATGREVRRVNRESLRWLWLNQLGRSMVDPERAVIYRGARRRFPANRIFIQLGRASSLVGIDPRVVRSSAFLRLNATCRPYHLGWVLHAWCGRLDRVEGEE